MTSLLALVLATMLYVRIGGKAEHAGANPNH